MISAHVRILDLAIGGVSLLVDDAAALPDVGASVRLDLRLDGPGRWLHVLGSVARIAPCGSGSALVIVFLEVPPDFEDLVEDELLFALECAHVPRVLLVDGRYRRRALVAAAFRAIGYRVIEVSSPLEAIAEIDQSRLHLWAIVIADTKLGTQADELRELIGEMYPAVPVIDVGQRVHATGATRLSVDGFPDLALQVVSLVNAHEQLGGIA